MKRLETEKESLSTELVQAKVAASKAETGVDQVVQGKKALEEQVQDLKEDKERLTNANAEVTHKNRTIFVFTLESPCRSDG